MDEDPGEERGTWDEDGMNFFRGAFKMRLLTAYSYSR